MDNFKMNRKLTKLAEIFSPAKLYAVGGFVRNSILGCTPSDIDISCQLTVDEVKNLLCGSEYIITAAYNKLGTLKIKDGEGNSYEYTTFRKEIYESGGGHKPCYVEFCSDILSDAQRRDFTVNAIYYDIQADIITDPLNGVRDLQNKIIKAADIPGKVFSSDGLRLLRMVRFACELGFEIEEETFKSAKDNFMLIKDIKSERIYEELNKILKSDLKYPYLSAGKYPHYRGMELLKELNILPLIIPGIELCYNIPQRADFHKYDVLEHIFQTIKYSDSSVRLSALLHDIGKGYCFASQGNFYGHENTGAEKAKEILGQNGLKCSNKLMGETVFLIKYHTYDLNCLTGENKVKWFIANNYDMIKKLLLLKQADYLGCGLKSGINPTVSRWEKIISDMKKENTPIKLKDLKIGGEKLLILNCPKPLISTVLKELHKECVFYPKQNTEEKLIITAGRIIDKIKRA